MPGYSLVPVDYQPDFGDYSLVPVDYDPFAADGVTQQAQIQQAQAQPQGPPQQQPATGAGQPDAGAPAAGGGPSGSEGGGIGPTGGAPNPTLDQGAAKAAPFGGYSLVPVDYQPDFDRYSLVPVDYDPFAADGMIQQARTQLESQPQRLAAGADLPDVGASASSIEGASNRSRPLLLAAAGDSYPTADAAAIAALQDINPTSQRYGVEYAGRVYQKWLGFGDYSYTQPSEGTAFSSSPGSRLTPLLHSLGVNAGMYHTHTRGLDPESNEGYSLGDKDKSDGEGAPSYLGTPRGMIYKYSPIPNHPSQGDVSVLGNTSGSSKKSPPQP
jgi:Domain of unknown function (DUF4329)